MMRTKLSFLMIGLAVLVFRAPLLAHHSFAAEYDGTKPVALKGTITSMQWTNPHGHLYIDVKSPDGKVVNWNFEFGAPNALMRRGWRKTDLPVGSVVTVQGFLAKDGTPTVNATNVTLPDGRKLFAGTSGAGAAPGAPPEP